MIDRGDDVGQRVVLDDELPRGVLDRGLRTGGCRTRGVALARRRRIPLGLRVDERRCLTVTVDVARGRERGHDAPPQVGVDGQARQAVVGRIGVEQCGEHGDVTQREHRGAQGVDVGQLVVRSGFGAAGQLEQPVGEGRPAVRAGPVRVGVGAAARSAPASGVVAPHRLRFRRGRRPMTRATKSRAFSSASRVISHAADQASVRGSGSAMSAMRVSTVCSDSGSSRSEQ